MRLIAAHHGNVSLPPQASPTCARLGQQFCPHHRAAFGVTAVASVQSPLRSKLLPFSLNGVDVRSHQSKHCQTKSPCGDMAAPGSVGPSSCVDNESGLGGVGQFGSPPRAASLRSATHTAGPRWGSAGHTVNRLNRSDARRSRAPRARSLGTGSTARQRPPVDPARTQIFTTCRILCKRRQTPLTPPPGLSTIATPESRRTRSRIRRFIGGHQP